MPRLIPVIAHLESNPILRKDLKKIEDWVFYGNLLQLTSQSLKGGFGLSARTVSFRLLERGTGRRPPRLTESRHPAAG